MPDTATPSAAPPATAAAGDAARKPVKPIPPAAGPAPGQEATAGVAPSEAPPRARRPDGTFAPVDRNAEFLGLLDQGEVVDPADRAVTDLDGNEPERTRVRVSKRPSAREALGAGDDPDAPALRQEVGSQEAPKGGEPSELSGALATEGSAGDQAVPAEAPPAEPDLSDPNALIELVIDGAPVVYKNRAHLVQAVKSLRGMYNAAEKAKLDNHARAHANYASAQAWKDRAERLQSGAVPPSTEGRSQVPAPAGPDASARQAITAAAETSGAPEDVVAQAVNWDHYNIIKKEHGPEVATNWANVQMVAAMEARISKRIEEMQRPARETEALFREGEAWGKTMRDMESWIYDDGTPMYPEFSDDTVVEQLGRVLSKMKQDGLSPDWLKTPRGIHTAVLTWRDWRRAKGQPWSPASNGSAAAPPAANSVSSDGVSEAVQSVAASARTLQGRTAPARPATPGQAREARVKNAIMDADKNPHGDWPWAP